MIASSTDQDLSIKCVLLDLDGTSTIQNVTPKVTPLFPTDATPRQIKFNKVPFVLNNEPLLGILDKFQEGRSYMAIVCHFSIEKAKSIKKAIKQSLTERIR